MAEFAAIFPPAGPATKLTVATVTSSAVQTLGGINFLFAINANQDVTIAFGTAANGFSAATANDWRIPAGVVATFDTGQFDSFAVFNLAGTSANVYILPLSRF